MICGERSEPSCKCCAVAIRQLIGVQLYLQAVRGRGSEDARGLLGRKADSFTESVNRLGEALRGDCWNQLVTDQTDVCVCACGLGRDRVSPRKVVTIVTGRRRDRARAARSCLHSVSRLRP